MKKKTLALIIALIVTISLSACGSDAGTADKQTAKGGTPEKAVSVEEELTDEEAEAEETVVDKIEEDKKKEKANDLEVTFEPFTVEAGDCSLTFKEIGTDENGYKVSVVFENNSDDARYTFGVEDAYADGLCCDPFFSTTVTAGNKANGDIYLSEDVLNKLESDPTQIDLFFTKYKSEDWSKDPNLDLITIYPYGEENASLYQHEEEATDQVLVDKNGVSMTFLEAKWDDFWGYRLSVYLQNSTDKHLMYAIKNVSVNGQMIEPSWALDWAAAVKSGKTKYSHISWDKETLEENEIEKVEEVTMTIFAYEYDHIEDGYVVEETVTFNITD